MLNNMPDLSKRLTWNEATVGMEVDIFPNSGNITTLSVAAIGNIKSLTDGDAWILPEGLNRSVQRVSKKLLLVLVRVTKVFARGLKILYLQTQKGKLVYISDITKDQDTFDVMLLACQLSCHLALQTEYSKALWFNPTPINQSKGRIPIENRRQLLRKQQRLMMVVLKMQ